MARALGFNRQESRTNYLFERWCRHQIRLSKVFGSSRSTMVSPRRLLHSTGLGLSFCVFWKKIICVISSKTSRFPNRTNNPDFSLYSKLFFACICSTRISSILRVIAKMSLWEILNPMIGAIWKSPWCLRRGHSIG